MRALVTGSTGCVGANLVAALNNRGIDVVGLRRKSSPEDAIGGLKLTFVTGDILDTDSLSQAMSGIDWVFHVAAVADYWHTAPDVIYRVNVEGTRNVLEAALRSGVRRVVATGSTASLGVPRPGKPLLDETDSFNLRPADFPYGHSKQLAWEAVQEYAAKGLDVVTVLPSAVIGPRDLKFNAGELIAQALQGGILPFPAGGLNYVDALDCVQGHIAAAEKGRTGERYILAGHNMTHAETVNEVNRALGTRARSIPLPRWLLPAMATGADLAHRVGIDLPVDRGRVILSGHYIYYDNSKAIHDLEIAFRPFTESVRMAYEWYAENDYLRKRGLRPLQALPQMSGN